MSGATENSMENSVGKPVLVVLTNDEARIWGDGLNKGSMPTRVEAPPIKSSMSHQRMTVHQSGHAEDPITWGYFDKLAEHLKSEGSILLMGHGHASANAAERFEKFANENFKEISQKIVGNINVNLNAITENEMLAIGREWFENYQRTGLKLS